MTSVTRYHDISAGHRVVGHEGKCKHLHGHNYRIRFTCVAGGGGLDRLGRVVDFSVVKSTLCEWLEANWDHRMLLWEEDEDFEAIWRLDSSVVAVPFNPTAEKMAEYLVHAVGPQVLAGSGVKLMKVVVEETRKCSATYELQSVP